MRPLRVYVDTSVFGGMFDVEYAEDTQRFFNLVDAGRFCLVVSDQVQDEIIPAPPEVRRFFYAELPSMEYLAFTPKVRELAELYITNEVVSGNHRADAMHVAYATVHKCTGVVSWNFKHMLKPYRRVRFNLANVESGHPQLFIASPKEVENHEE